MAVVPELKFITMADGCFASRSATAYYKALSHRVRPLRTKAIVFLRLSCSSSSPSLPPFFFTPTKKTAPSFVSLVAQTSGWTRQDEGGESLKAGIAEEDSEWTNEDDEFGLSAEEGADAGFSEWEGGNQTHEDAVGEVVAEGNGPPSEEFDDEEGGESYPEPPEDAKLFVGNLTYDVDSEKLAYLFEKAGVVEIAEVIYFQKTDQSRGFGFVTMSTVEEAEKAIEMFHHYDHGGRLLTVNKAAPRGSTPMRLSRDFEPSPRIFVGNLPWRMDDDRLEQVFSEHGKVVNARVVCDRETGRSRGFGFVTMASKGEVDDAIAALDGQSLDGRPIKVNVAEERPPRVRSF